MSSENYHFALPSSISLHGLWPDCFSRLAQRPHMAGCLRRSHGPSDPPHSEHVGILGPSLSSYSTRYFRRRPQRWQSLGRRL